MGGYLTRNRNHGEDNGSSSTQNAYKYPPKTGKKFILLVQKIRSLSLYTLIMSLYHLNKS